MFSVACKLLNTYAQGLIIPFDSTSYGSGSVRLVAKVGQAGFLPVLDRTFSFNFLSEYGLTIWIINNFGMYYGENICIAVNTLRSKQI